MKRGFQIIIIIALFSFIISILGCSSQNISESGNAPEITEIQDIASSNEVPSISVDAASELDNNSTSETIEAAPASEQKPAETPSLKLNEFNMMDKYKTEFVKDVDILKCQSKTYFTDSTVTEVIEWYYSTLPYTLVFKNIFNATEKPGVELGILVLKKETDGIYIDIQPSLDIPIATGKTLVIFAECPWGILKPVVGDVSGDLTGGADIGWSNALVLEDSLGDFWMGGGSPPQLIKYNPSDMLKVYIKNDDTYLYIKYELAGPIPTLPEKQGSDNVRILTYFTLIDKDQNPGTGIKNGYVGADLALDAWFGSPAKANGKMYALMQYYFYDSAGEEELGPAKEGSSKLVAGGVNNKFVTVKYKLSDLGLKKGDAINVFPLIEAESDSYHHFARDVYKTDVTWASYKIS